MIGQNAVVWERSGPGNCAAFHGWLVTLRAFVLETALVKLLLCVLYIPVCISVYSYFSSQIELFWRCCHVLCIKICVLLSTNKPWPHQMPASTDEGCMGYHITLQWMVFDTFSDNLGELTLLVMAWLTTRAPPCVLLASLFK